jgi:hypothetical protein
MAKKKERVCNNYERIYQVESVKFYVQVEISQVTVELDIII